MTLKQKLLLKKKELILHAGEFKSCMQEDFDNAKMEGGPWCISFELEHICLLLISTQVLSIVTCISDL
jgi:hypothetical protein